MEDFRDTAEEATEGQQIDYRSIIKPTLQYELYNPSDKPMHFSKAGVDFYLPARDKRWRGKDPSTGQTFTYPKPGVMPVWGIPDQKITALNVVQFAVGPDGVSGVIGVNGARALFGDEEKDEAVYEDAKKAWLKKQLSDWTLTIQGHERAVAKARESGDPMPNPGRIVREAYDNLAKYGSEAEEFLQVRCATCNWGFPDEKAMWEHVFSMHRDRRAEAEKALGIEGDTGGKVERVPVRPVEQPPVMSEEDRQEAERLLSSGHSEAVSLTRSEEEIAAAMKLANEKSGGKPKKP